MFWTGMPRPAKRIPLKIQFKLAGHDENGTAFEDYVETVDISTGGGCLIASKDVRKGENLRLYSPKGSVFIVNVRWFRYDKRKDLRYLGFMLIEAPERWVLG